METNGSYAKFDKGIMKRRRESVFNLRRIGKGEWNPCHIRNTSCLFQTTWRRGSESNRRMRLLQSPALPLGYPATQNSHTNFVSRSKQVQVSPINGFCYTDRSMSAVVMRWEGNSASVSYTHLT